MNFRVFSSNPFVSFLFVLFLVLIKIPLSLSNTDYYTSCSRLFTCGNITVGHPFWGNDRPKYCGHPDLKLVCVSNVTTIEINNVRYRVLNVDENVQILKLAREDYLNGLCPSQLVSTNFYFTPFDFAPNYGSLTIYYGCPPPPVPVTILKISTCPKNGVNHKGRYIQIVPRDPQACNATVLVPIPRTSLFRENYDLPSLERALKEGFEVRWKVDIIACNFCTESKGRCGFDPLNETTCYCPNQPFRLLRTCASPPAARGPYFHQTWKFFMGLAASVAGIIMVSILLMGCKRRKFLSHMATVFWRKKTQNDQNMEAILNNGSFAPQRYKYSDVEKMTNLFRDRLGQGGYGCVYKGKLPDGRLVAVKVLNKSKGNGEEFINEVTSISRTSHVNVVTLLGFCYEGSKRALIYEFMPNGSLDKFIYEQGSSDTNRNLDWKTLYKIAVGIARGLEYLHQGCNTRILHFDIKPQNILLDENFCPKISDFGLAKLCKREESIVSMINPRGTYGYIAPEVFCRSFGGVSYKSDVYSYGMMVLEMVGGRKNMDVGVSDTSQIYFPLWICDHIESCEDLRLHGIMTQAEEDIARKMTIVSLWCIQTIPTDRPSMTKVVEMLEGRLQSLQIPPKSFP